MSEIATKSLRIEEATVVPAPSGDGWPHAAVTPVAMTPAAATVEHALYAVIFVAALGARLLLLGAAPMATHEAAAAWAAWMDATALHPAAAPATSSALLHALQTFVFWISGGGNETLARLPVALISSILPLLAWFWRDRLGRPAALALAALLAIDPWLLAFGRMADPTALSVALALCALTATHVATRGAHETTARSTPALVAAVATGLLLVSGPQAWPWLIVLALYVLIAVDDRSVLFSRYALVAGALAALLGATGWLAWPQELAMVGASLGQWLSLLQSGAYNLLWPATRLLVDQPFLLLFGLAAFVNMWLRPTVDSRGRLFLTLWLAWALLLLLMPGRGPELLPLFGLPLAIGAALAVQWLFNLALTRSDLGRGGAAGDRAGCGAHVGPLLERAVAGAAGPGHGGRADCPDHVGADCAAAGGLWLVCKSAPGAGCGCSRDRYLPAGCNLLVGAPPRLFR